MSEHYLSLFGDPEPDTSAADLQLANAAFADLLLLLRLAARSEQWV